MPISTNLSSGCSTRTLLLYVMLECNGAAACQQSTWFKTLDIPGRVMLQCR